MTYRTVQEVHEERQKLYDKWHQVNVSIMMDDELKKKELQTIARAIMRTYIEDLYRPSPVFKALMEKPDV